jgi:hypothetical protein
MDRSRSDLQGRRYYEGPVRPWIACHSKKPACVTRRSIEVSRVLEAHGTGTDADLPGAIQTHGPFVFFCLLFKRRE